jgi:hypothetical protein
MAGARTALEASLLRFGARVKLDQQDIHRETRRATFGVKVRVCVLIPAYSDMWGNAFRILML